MKETHPMKTDHKRTNRKVHLDFHTPHWVKQVGGDYDPETLVSVWKKARVNAVTVVFGCCACGNAYYDSPAAPVHPGLQRDMLTPLLEAAKREDIAIYVHFSLLHDRAVIEHPEWAMQLKDGSRLDTDGGKAWGWPCFNSPFVEQWVWPQLADFVPRFPDAAGIFLDMVMYPENACYCNYCREKAEVQRLDLDCRADMELFQSRTLQHFMRYTRSLIKNLNPDMEFTCNNQWYIGGAREEALDFIELEAPVSWNSYHFPVMARYIRTLTKPSGGMTTRFPKNWGYFGSLNNENQLKFECATILATLGACCIGDQLHPSGKPDEGVYELIGEAYRFVEEREEWTLGAESVPYLAVLADDQRSTEVRTSHEDYYDHQSASALYGAGLVLLEGNRHFDVLDERSDFSAYSWIWLPENKTLSPAIAESVKRYVADGGRLLVTGNGLWREKAWRDVLEEMADVKYLGVSDMKGHYIRPLPVISDGIPDAPYFIKGEFARLQSGSGTEIIAKAHAPYENIDPSIRFGHFHAPVGEETAEPAAVLRSFGRGKIAAVAASLAADYFSIGSGHIRRIVLNLIDHMIPPAERLVEISTISPSIEISLMRQKRRWMLHLVQYAAKRHTGNTVIEEIPVRYHIPVAVKTPMKPALVLLAPSGNKLEWEWREGRVHTIVPELHIHQMVVFEFE